jgi:hypothetical protein
MDHFLQADFPLLIAVSRHQITSVWPTIREVTGSAHTLALVGAIQHRSLHSIVSKENLRAVASDDRLGSSSVGGGLDAVQFRILAALDH